MPKPINYYIQLSDDLSIQIDSMDKHYLIRRAMGCLNFLDIFINLESDLDNEFISLYDSWNSAKECGAFMERHGLKDGDDILRLAHGLLAKAL